MRMYSFDNRSYNLFEKEFVAGYQFMKVERNGADIFYCIDWKYVVLILENFVVKMLKSNNYQYVVGDNGFPDAAAAFFPL